MNIKENKMIGYHVTLEKHLSLIFKEGLKPSIPIDAPNDVKGVYFFRTKDEVFDGMCAWFCDRQIFKEDDVEAILEVNLTGLDKHIVDCDKYDWEMIYNCIIEPSRIKQITEL